MIRGTANLICRALIVAALSAAMMAGIAPARGAAQEPALSEQPSAERTLGVTAGKSAILSFPQGLNRVSVGNPEVLDAVVLSPREVLLNGKAPGVTSLILSGGGTNRIYDVIVSNDAQLLQGRLQAMFPDESIQVSADRDLLVLSGRINDPYVAQRALTMARTYS
ncbi:MAG: pilus assembly protein N-terminal domain-containing protein, partial [Gemmatimonadetes bacterium]|nr:pilus assembly protein N-terminal domain-containing protein [Gemmatimonadota bacterium]